MGVPGLIQIHLDDIYEHLYEVYVSHPPRHDQHLGYVDKSKDLISVSCAGEDFLLTQSLSSLSANESSTGFICWQTTSLIADWVTSDSKCPFKSFFTRDSIVLELGAGVSSILTCVLAPLVGHYIASDQKPLLKLLKQNFQDNFHKSFSSSTLDSLKSNNCIDIIEFDWEDVDLGIYNFNSVSQAPPDLIIACDTIYNEYLVEPFLNSCSALLNSKNGVLVALQLRDESVLETFLGKVFDQHLKLFYVPPGLLSEGLVAGFAVYYIVN